MGGGERALALVPVLAAGHAVPPHRRRPAGRHAGQRAKDDQRRGHQQQGQQARQHQVGDRVDAQHAQRVDLVTGLHAGQLGGKRRAQPAGQDDAGHQPGQLTHHAHRHHVGQKTLGADAAQLRPAHIGQHQPDQRAGEQNDGQRAWAGLVELLQHVGGPQRRAAAQPAPEGDQHLAEEGHGDGGVARRARGGGRGGRRGWRDAWRGGSVGRADSGCREGWHSGRRRRQGQHVEQAGWQRHQVHQRAAPGQRVAQRPQIGRQRGVPARQTLAVDQHPAAAAQVAGQRRPARVLAKLAAVQMQRPGDVGRGPIARRQLGHGQRAKRRRINRRRVNSHLGTGGDSAASSGMGPGRPRRRLWRPAVVTRGPRLSDSLSTKLAAFPADC